MIFFKNSGSAMVKVASAEIVVDVMVTQSEKETSTSDNSALKTKAAKKAAIQIIVSFLMLNHSSIR